MANIHPFFSGINVTGAADWTLQFLTNNVVSTTTSLNPAPPIIISEGRRPRKVTDNSGLAHWLWLHQ
jgi:hypothetical protein